MVARRNEHDPTMFAMALERVMCFDMTLILFRVRCHSGILDIRYCEGALRREAVRSYT